MAEALLEELLETVLLRIPPHNPASLLSAALVSKRWCRLICGPGFRRRFREFHGKPPLLGLVCHRQIDEQKRFFFPSSSFRPLHHGDGDQVPLHSYHSHVLLYSFVDHRFTFKNLFVWDPITDKLRKLPRWKRNLPSLIYQGNAAVLCAGTVADGGCNNTIDCHHGPFMVIRIPRDGILEQICDQHIRLLRMEDGRLGFASMPNWSTLTLWSRREHGSDEDAGWEQSRVIEPDATLIPKDYLKCTPFLAAFADTGAGGVIFIRLSVGHFSLNLKSLSCKEVWIGDQWVGIGRIVPYVSFCTPALGAVSIDEAPGGSEPSA